MTCPNPFAIGARRVGPSSFSYDRVGDPSPPFRPGWPVLEAKAGADGQAPELRRAQHRVDAAQARLEQKALPHTPEASSSSAHGYERCLSLW
jgi:hypothetical protein